MLNDLYQFMEELTDPPEEFGKPYFSQERYYEAVELDKKYFTELKTKRDGRKICCVDGGNNKIFESPTDSIHLIRIYFNLFEGENRVINTEPLTAFLISKLEGEKIISELKVLKGDIPFREKKFSLGEQDLEELSLTNAAHTVRKYLEWGVLEYVIEEHLEEDDILVRDGVLQTTVESEREYSERAYEKVEESGVILVGLAKTSSLKTTKNYPLIAAVKQLARETKKDMWYYHPIAENSHPDHKGDMFIVKYHPSSEYAFRTEFYREIEVDHKEVFGELAFQAQDPVFLGYPYGLVDADKKARVTDEEVDYLKNMAKNKMNSTFRDKINSVNAHDRLSEL